MFRSEIGMFRLYTVIRNGNCDLRTSRGRIPGGCQLRIRSMDLERSRLRECLVGAERQQSTKRFHAARVEPWKQPHNHTLRPEIAVPHPRDQLCKGSWVEPLRCISNIQTS